MTNVLITGISGFVGSHLAEYVLTYLDVRLYGIVRYRSNLKNIEHIKNKVTLIEADLRDLSSLIKGLNGIDLNRIFHLAANSYVPFSWRAPSDVIANNVIGEANLFEALIHLFGKDDVKKIKIQIAGSSEEYGLVYHNEIPINENNPLRPLSSYGVSKIAQDFLALQYAKSYGMQIVRTRAFNHTGPRRGEFFMTSSFAKQIAEIELGLRKPILFHGNLDAIRDFTDVRDIVRAYWLALDYCGDFKDSDNNVFNIGQGIGWSVKTILNILLQYTSFYVRLKLDENRMRPSDVPILICNSEKFRQLTGWKPTIKIDKTMEDLLNYWRKELK